jgi:hypothetical protein
VHPEFAVGLLPEVEDGSLASVGELVSARQLL